MKKQIFYLLGLIVVIGIGCQKEESFELGNTPSRGSLQSDATGDCLPKTVSGTYAAATPLVPTSNTITVTVDVARTGTYNIGTDTINGYYFRGTGQFTALGANTVTLRGNGTPFASRVDNFVVSFDSTVCDIQVTVLPAGAGGPATFTLFNGGTPANCASADVRGTYVNGIAVNASNYVDITVNVATIGTYPTITATGGGMTFSKAAGAFTATGNQQVRLTASGTPNTVGANTITFAAPFASCSFTVTVSGQANYTIDCPNVMVNGNYQVGVPLTAANNIVIPITVTTAGAYSITASVNGMTFSNSGNLTLATTSITLNSSPAAPTGPAGVYALTIGTCNIPITVTAAPSIDWKFNIGTTLYQGSTFDVTFDNTSSPPVTFFDYIGDNAASDEMEIVLGDLTGGIQANETYNSTSGGLTNIGAFYFIDGAATIDLTAEPGTPPTGNMVIRVTSHNTATRTIKGTFSGTAFDSISNTNKTISAGEFTAVY